MNKNKPTLAVPKGRLYTEIKKLFNSCDIDMPDEDTKQYYFPDWSDDCSLFIAKPKAIPELIANKFCEFGMCGYDIVKNYENEDCIEQVVTTNLNRVKLCLASKKSFEELKHLKRPVICATEYDIIANHYFTRYGIPHYVLNTTGSTEGYIDIGADCIIDVVETGKTLKANNINILDTLVDTYTCMFMHSSLMDCWLPKNIQTIYNYEQGNY